MYSTIEPVRMLHHKPVLDWPGSWWGRSGRGRWACLPAVVYVGFRVFGFRGLGSRVQGFRGLGFRVQGFKFKVYLQGLD